MFFLTFSYMLVSESLMSYVALYFPTYIQREARGAWY